VDELADVGAVDELPELASVQRLDVESDEPIREQQRRPDGIGSRQRS
jgi:hypothetical protein